MRATRDPRPEIAVVAVRALGFLGPRAVSALPRLKEIAAGDDAAMRRAAESAADAVQSRRGHILCADFQAGQLLELDGAGQVRTKIGGFRELRDCQRLDNGRYLIVDAAGVREIDASGAMTWSFDVKAACDAERLSDGHTLVADTENGKVVEVDRDGRVVWTFAAETDGFRPVDADRLPDGHTLIADYQLTDAGRVFEVNGRGRVVWEYSCRQASAVERLPDGRTLITSHKPGAVRVIDPRGRVERSIESIAVPASATMLPNGHIIVAAEGAVCEFDADDVEVWRVVLAWASEIQRY